MPTGTFEPFAPGGRTERFCPDIESAAASAELRVGMNAPRFGAERTARRLEPPAPEARGSPSSSSSLAGSIPFGFKGADLCPCSFKVGAWRTEPTAQDRQEEAHRGAAAPSDGRSRGGPAPSRELRCPRGAASWGRPPLQRAFWEERLLGMKLQAQNRSSYRRIQRCHGINCCTQRVLINGLLSHPKDGFAGDRAGV